MTDTDVWGGEVDTAPVREVVRTAPHPGYTPEVGREAWAEAVHHAGTLVETARMLDRAVMHGAQFQIDTLSGAHIVGLIALMQDVRRALATTEASLARTVGQDEATPRTGVLPDGRQYEVRKGNTRKAWDHDTWKHDARVAVLARHGVAGVLVDPDTGEQVNVAEVIAEVQQVHGSTAPRATALRALGLRADDYCEAVPGPWSVQVQGDAGED